MLLFIFIVLLRPTVSYKLSVQQVVLVRLKQLRAVIIMSSSRLSMLLTNIRNLSQDW